MHATDICKIALVPPRVGLVMTAKDSAPGGVNFDEIEAGTLSPVSTSDFAEFKAYLMTIPFDFANVTTVTVGLDLHSEAGVRLFYEANAILACWPIALAMIPADRNYDLVLQSEKPLLNISRPDITISAVRPGVSGAAGVDLLCLGFQCPGTCKFAGNSDQPSSDDWDIVARQVRKYAVLHCVSVVLLMDDKYCLYFEFEDA